MSKKRKHVPLAVSKHHKQAANPQNPFELKRSKRKFEVLGRRVKGDSKNVVQARQDAVNKVGWLKDLQLGTGAARRADPRICNMSTHRGINYMHHAVASGPQSLEHGTLCAALPGQRRHDAFAVRMLPP